MAKAKIEMVLCNVIFLDLSQDVNSVDVNIRIRKHNQFLLQKKIEPIITNHKY